MTKTKQELLTSLQVKSISQRAATFVNEADLNADTIPVVFSTEVKVLEMDLNGEFYFEVLDHSPDSVDRSEMVDGNLSFMESHMQYPMITLGSIKDIVFPQDKPAGEREGRGNMIFSQSDAGRNAEQDFRGGHRRNVSVGLEKLFPPISVTIDPETNYPILKFRWKPLEVSAVHLPADPNTGAFRSAGDDKDIKSYEIPIKTTRGNTQMSLTEEQLQAKETELAQKEAELNTKVESFNKRSQSNDPDEAGKITVELDQYREKSTRGAMIDGLVDLAVTGMEIDYKDIAAEAQKYKNENLDPAGFRSYITSKAAEAKQSMADDKTLGLSAGEQRRFSLVNTLRACHEGVFTADNPLVSFEVEVSKQADKLNSSGFSRQETTTNRSFTIPKDILTSTARMMARRSQLTQEDLKTIAMYTGRSMSSDQALKGGAWTDVTTMRFIDYLYSATIADRIGVTSIPGLTGDFKIPVLSGIQTSYMRGEHEAATLSDLTTEFRKMTPHLLSTGTKISHLLKIKASPIAIDAIVEKYMAKAQALKRNEQLLYGTGGNSEILGIANNTAINIVSGGTNGAVPSQPNYNSMRTLVHAADAASLPGETVFLMNSLTIGKNRVTAIESGQTDRVMATNVPAGSKLSCIGHEVFETNLLRANLTKGSGTDLSEAFFLKPSEIFEGRWGDIRVKVDESTAASTDETITYIHEYVDYIIGHPVAVSYMKDLITV